MFGCMVAVQAEDSPELRKRLLEEAPAAQRQLRDRYLAGVSFQCRLEKLAGTSKNEDPPENMVSRSVATVNRFYSFPGYAQEPVAFDKIAAAERATVVNDRYASRIRRANTNSPWVVDNIGKDAKLLFMKGASPGLAALSLPEILVHRFQIPVLDVDGYPIDQFFVAPGIVIDSVEADERGRVKVTLSGEIASPLGKDRITSATVWLLPAKAWAVDEYTLKLFVIFGDKRIEGEQHREIEWTRINDLDVPAKMTMLATLPEGFLEEIKKDPTLTSFATRPAGRSVSEWRMEFTNWEKNRLPPERFTLSHYGLSEPDLSATQ